MLDVIPYCLNTEVPWRGLPEQFGPRQGVHSHYRAWTLAGVWKNILAGPIVQDLVDETTLMSDGTSI